MQHVSSGEALAMWGGMFGLLAGVYQWVKSTDPEGQNPAVNRSTMSMVGPMATGPARGKAFLEKN